MAIASAARLVPHHISLLRSGLDNLTKRMDTSNPDEAEIMKELKEHAGRSLESDLLDSATALGLSQVGFVVAQPSSFEH